MERQNLVKNFLKDLIFSFESQRRRSTGITKFTYIMFRVVGGWLCYAVRRSIVEAAAVFSSSHGQKVCELWKKSFHNQSAPFLGLLSPLIFYQKWPSSCMLRGRRRQRRHFQHYFVSTKKEQNTTTTTKLLLYCLLLFLLLLASSRFFNQIIKNFSTQNFSIRKIIFLLENYSFRTNT